MKKFHEMKLMKKILLSVAALFLVVAIIWLIYYLVHYYFYDEYKDYVSDYAYEEGQPFKALSDTEAQVEGMVLGAENDHYKLYTNPETAYVALYDKATGKTIYSNPLDSEEDEIATETNQNYLKSQMIIDYYNAQRTSGTYDTYTMSILNEQLAMESIENGFRYIYTVGDTSTTTGIVPIYIQKEVLEDVLSKMSEADAKYVKSRYMESKTVDGMMQMIKKAATGPSTLRKLNEKFETIGWTKDDYDEQMMLSGVEGAVKISFVIPLEYRLEEDGLSVTVPADAIEEYGGGKIYRIQLLRYMAAAGQDDEGYMVVPNGSGSIINFNNGKTAVENYSQYVYGMDPLSADYTQLEIMEKARLPLFAMCYEDSSVLATIEEGETISYINAGVSGKINSYNYAFAAFVMRGYEKLSMFGTTGNEADVPIVEEDLYPVDLTVKYTVLPEENKGYVGVANYYRQQLKDQGVLQQMEAQGDIPFYYDVIGGVMETAYFLGTQYESVNAMTTFEEAKQMSNDLAGFGITNQVMNYQGWFNGGYYHDVPDRVRVTGKLGGKSKLEDLSEAVVQNGGRFYADVAFQEVTFITKRYQYTLESSRYYGAGYVAVLGQLNPVNLRRTSGLGYVETLSDLVSPKFLPRYVNEFTKRIGRVDIYGIGLRDLGDELHSDRKRTNVINRQDALDVVTAQFYKLSTTDKKMLVKGGNEYSLAYASDITEAPLTDNDYFIIDAEIPLYEMIIHGSINYTGPQINLNDTYDKADTVLKLIETGASPHFIFSWDSSNELKYTGLNRYYATTYESWKTDAIDIYNQVNEALGQVSGCEITDHVIYDNGIRKVTYGNGVSIYINNTFKDLSQDGITIKARSYETEVK